MPCWPNHSLDVSLACLLHLALHLRAGHILLLSQAAHEVARRSPGVSISVFSDRDITSQRAKVEAALADADVFFGSLLFDFDQVCVCVCSTACGSDCKVSTIAECWQQTSPLQPCRANGAFFI